MHLRPFLIDEIIFYTDPIQQCCLEHGGKQDAGMLPQATSARGGTVEDSLQFGVAAYSSFLMRFPQRAALQRRGFLKDLEYISASHIQTVVKG